METNKSRRKTMVEEKPTIAYLKKTKQLMPKWVIGRRYINGYADSDILVYDVILTLKNIVSGELIIIDQDDRHGKYPLLNKAKMECIRDTHYQLRIKVQSLNNLVSLF